MTYNILDGGQKRLPLIAEIIAKESPDFISINEANLFSDQKLLEQFAQDIHMPYFDMSLSGKEDYHVAVFSKYPFQQVLKLKKLMRACLISVIASPFGKLAIAGLHLAPYEEDIRLEELDIILDALHNYKNTILMGDFNSLSGRDGYSQNIIKLFNDKQKRKFADKGSLRFDAMDMVYSGGFVDTAYECNKNKENTVPTESSIDDAHAVLRLDYIFVSKSLRVHIEQYQVIKNSLTEKASDHYPILLELQ